MRSRVTAALFAALFLWPVWALAQTTSCSSSGAAASSAAPAGAAAGGFTTRNGLIYGPNGQPFQARGVDVMEGNEPSAATLEAAFPGINYVRLALYDYPSAASLATYVDQLTSAGIVVELEDHSNSSGQNAGGGNQNGNVIFSGSELANENAWYSSIASAFASNPYVWFGTDNEPATNDAAGQNDPAALSAWQQSNYNAIRSTGNNNPILIEDAGASNMVPSYYAGMTNTILDDHYYGWVSGYSTDPSTVASTLSSSATQIQQAIPGANGVMPVIIGEYGPSTSGSSIDPNSQQVIAAVQSSGYGNVAWAYATASDGLDALLSSSGGLSSYGQEVHDYIESAANTCAGVPVITTPTATDPGPAIASGATTPTLSPTTASVDTQPIDTTATTGRADAVAPAATGTVAEPMGPAPSTTVVSTDPVISAPATSGSTAQVIPSYGAGGSGESFGVTATALAASSSNPSGDPIFSAASATPQQVVPKYGAGYASGTVTNSATGQTDTPAGQPDSTASVTPAAYTTETTATDPAATLQLQTMMSQFYGQTAAETADELGVNAAAVAAIAQMESGFQNVGTANGSTSATGPWQFTQGTFNTVSQSNDLGFSSADLTNPNAQATVAPYYLQQIASVIGAATGQPATTLQAYGGWVFGPDAGAQIANAASNTPLSALVSAQSLANNGMSGWTVGDFRAAMTTRLGAVANQTVLTTSGV